ncbi:hypothetical protein QUF76_05325 [Desulfobacterales bacterium HSG16]|nr:hypothetical protein [Desulfobacterales bacterium HSG16]
MLKLQSDPFQYMVEHRKIIIEILDQSSTLKNAWNMVVERLPAIGEVTKFNTFKGYVRILKVIDGQLSELTSENISIRKELGKVRQENEVLKERLGKVRYKSDKFEEELTKAKKELNGIASKQNATAELNNSAVEVSSDHEKVDTFADQSAALSDHEKKCVPKRVDGWGVQLRGQYYRMFKKINGKVKWIHIGKKWNNKTAREKIRSFGG